MNTVYLLIEVFNKGQRKPAVREHRTLDTIKEAAKAVTRAEIWYAKQDCTIRYRITNYFVK